MSRMTRAKEAAQLERNRHHDVQSPTALSEDRGPLCELSPNRASSSTGGDAAAIEHSRIGPQGHGCEAARTTRAARNEGAPAIPDEMRPVSAPAHAVRHARSRRDTEDAWEAPSHGLPESVDVSQHGLPVHQDTKPDESVQIAMQQTAAANVQSQISPAPPVSNPMPHVIRPSDQMSTATSGSSSADHRTSPRASGSIEMENVEPSGEGGPVEQAAVEASTLPTSHPNLPTISTEEPDVQHSRQKDQPPKGNPKKAGPTVRTTKASQARISLAHGLPDAPAKAPAMGRPRQSLSQSSAKRVTSTSSVRSRGGGGGGGATATATATAVKKVEVVIPHSKPRPMSMQFKAPPPPAKSTKAPTQSKFQLPGEAVAAKLRAAREARQQNGGADEGMPTTTTRKSFKARPAPSRTKAPTVRQTSTSKARESMISGKPLQPGSSDGAKSVATSTPTMMAPLARDAAPPHARSIDQRPRTVLGTATTGTRPNPISISGTNKSGHSRRSTCPRSFQAGKDQEKGEKEGKERSTETSKAKEKMENAAGA